MKKQILCSAFLCAMAIAPVALRAQGMGTMNSKPMDAAAAVSPAKVYGDLFKGEQEEIISAAEAMPADKYDFVPTAGTFTGVRSFGGQVNHLIGANYAFFRGFGMPMPVTREQIAAMKTKDQLVQGLKDSFAFANKAVASITAENAFMTVGKGDMAMTRAGAATYCLAHANDHYGQMVEYLRMNGIIPPASVKK